MSVAVPATKNRKTNIWVVLGVILIASAVIIAYLTFAPVLKSEIKYQLVVKNKTVEEKIVPVDSNFSVVIPKIRANARVVENVDPFDAKNYQLALSRGVAHAQGTSTPDKGSNTFLFAHSAGNWYQANQYNAIFYLLNKLEKGDEIILYFKDKEYVYLIEELKYVDGGETKYMNASKESKLTLMTCWPPGTTLKRLIVTAKLKEI